MCIHMNVPDEDARDGQSTYILLSSTCRGHAVQLLRAQKFKRFRELKPSEFIFSASTLTKALWVGKREVNTCYSSITGTANEGRFITTLAQIGRLWRRCHGSHTDCFPQVSMLPHEGKDLYPDLLAGGLIPQATGMHAGRKGLPS